MKILTACKIAVLLTVLVIVEGVNATAPWPTVYTHDSYRRSNIWPQWETMYNDPDCNGLFKAPRVVLSEWPEDAKGQFFAVIALQNEVQENFQYTADGISDHWCDELEAMEAGYMWQGDCDDFAITLARRAMRLGVKPENIVLMTVLTGTEARLQQWMQVNHPHKKHANHMAVAIWSEPIGQWTVFSNGWEHPQGWSRVFRQSASLDFDPFTYWVPHSIMFMDNFGPGTDNHVQGGWFSFWVFE